MTDEVQRQRRAKNESLLRQAKPGALIKVQVLDRPGIPRPNQPDWRSGRLESVQNGELVLRKKDGAPMAYDLRQVDVVLPPESRVDALPLE